MSNAAPSPPAAASIASGAVGTTTLTFAAWASLGAGAIHAAAIGVHADARQTALLFTAVATFQLGWGALALARQSRVIALVGALGSVALVGGWIVTQVRGIGFVDGLEAAQPAQTPDTLAALLAGLVTVLCAAAVSTGRDHAFWRPAGRLTSVAGVVAIVGLTLPALVGAADHDHDHGDGAAVGDHAHAAGDDHGTGDGTGDGEVAAGDHDDDHDGHGSPPVPPKAYDPAQPIDLGGVDDVTPQQQAAAENLIAVTLLRLPQYADPAAAEAAGYRSIGDGFTGHEHYLNQSKIDDGRILDPDHPESLVFEMRDGQKTLVAAMYMLTSTDTLDDVPELGGALTQWHIHNDLCFTDDPVTPMVRGLTNPDGTCNPPLVQGTQAPMIHVWIVPHECGPFAALDGIAGGQIPEGEERLCDHAHGA